MSRYRWFTLAGIIGLSLGIACSILIFLFAYGHLSMDRHHRSADRIYRVVLQIQTPSGNIEYEPGTSLPMHKTLPLEMSGIEASAFCIKFYSPATISVTRNGTVNRFREEGNVAYANAGFLEMFHHEFLAGNKNSALTLPGEVAISENLARKYFGSVDAAMGQVLTINNLADVAVRAVFASDSRRTDLDFELLVSLPTLKTLIPTYQEENYTWIGSNNWVFVRLAEGTSPSAIERLLPAYSEKYLGAQFNHWRFYLQPLSEMHFDTRYDGMISRSIIWILLGVAAMLTLVVSSNYVNLAIAQSHHRSREIGIRKYLGGSRKQLFIQFMTETGLLIALALIVACGIVWFALPVVGDWIQFDMSFDNVPPGIGIAFIAFLAIGLSLLAGYYPAVRLSGYDPVKAINGRITDPEKKQTGRKMLLTFQYAVAIFFLSSTMVMVGQVDFLLKSDSGFDRENIVNVRVPRGDVGRLETFRHEIAKLAGVSAASLHNEPPMTSGNDGGFIRVAGRQEFEDFIVRERWGDEHFLETYSIRLVAGRNLVVRGDTLAELLVNEAFIERLGTTDPTEILGTRILIDNSGTHGEIVGVVKDFHNQSLQGEIEPLVINPMQALFNRIGIRVEGHGMDRTLNEVKTLFEKTFPEALFEYAFVDDSIRRMYRTEEATGRLMRIFTLVAVVISLIGILGLSAYTNVRRSREMAIRKVLGASVTDIVGLLCSRHLFLFVVGFALAVPATWLLTRQWLGNFAYRIEPGWPLLAAPGILLIAVTLLLLAMQSLKTARTNPARSINRE